MRKNYLQVRYLFLLFFVSSFTLAQESPVLILSIPYQNSLLYNRFLVNPTFSFVGEKDTNISLFSGSQLSAFSDAPKAYQLNYSGRFSDRTGFGISVYQQNLGVITSFGGIGNCAYYVPFSDDMGLTLGSNIVFYNSGIDMSRVDVENVDPLLLSLDKRSLFSFHPGMNFNYKKFDVGAYAENLLNYDFNSDSFVKSYAETTVSGHLMYTDFFENGSMLRMMASARSNKTLGVNTGLSALGNFPNWGWVQGGFDSYYGLGLGGGFHLSKKLSVGYVYEKTTRLGMQNWGASHEFNLVFTLDSGKSKEVATKISAPKKLKASSIAKTDLNDLSDRENFINDPEAEILGASLKVVGEGSINNLRDKENFIENREDEVLGASLLVDDAIAQTDEPELPKPKKDVKLHAKRVDLSKMNEKEIKEVFSNKTLYKRDVPKTIDKVFIEDKEIQKGFYIVAGVFSNPNYAERLIRRLKRDDIAAASFVSPKNNYNYVYLRSCDTRKEALMAYYTNLDNTYFDTIWLLEVDKS